ncbi:MAG: GAF domain-containing protein [Pyrinomonadaceae bacterium]|nr:GAF domain-containing protein [Pyrinomonadaceae bacterium]MDQ3135331.1 GAF domain-containing protein [Acidobacteriota bacterium]
MALLHITDGSGRRWQYTLSPQLPCTIGRAPDNCIVLNDPRASRHHAHVTFAGGAFVLVDGTIVGSRIKRSANKVLVQGQPRTEHQLQDGDQIKIGNSLLRFEQATAVAAVNYDNQPLGRTQMTIPVREALSVVLRTSDAVASARLSTTEIAALRRKADILALLYELSKTLALVFDPEVIFNQVTEIILRVTPADRVVALLGDQSPDGDRNTPTELRQIAARARNAQLTEQMRDLTIGRTITSKAMRERVALLSQDATADAQFGSAQSIISQGVRSTICAPLAGESCVYGALYADRLDPHAVFTRDDLELLSAIAAQTTVALENARSHKRLAREEVARSNYGRFLPEYVVRQMLEHPESFQLGGTNQTITVLFADVRGFTRLAEHAPPTQVVELLNKYFTAMTEIIFAHGGTLDKYIGDGLMALFGAPTATPQDAAHAVQVAIAMQRQMTHVNADLRAGGLPEIHIGIGLHTGEATVGYIGSERRTEYTAIGDTVNLAARLESNARPGQILLSESVIQACLPADTFPVVQQPPLSVKNRIQPVPVYEMSWQNDVTG